MDQSAMKFDFWLSIKYLFLELVEISTVKSWKNKSEVISNSQTNFLELYSISCCFPGHVVLDFVNLIYFVINIEFIFAFPTKSKST